MDYLHANVLLGQILEEFTTKTKSFSRNLVLNETSEDVKVSIDKVSMYLKSWQTLLESLREKITGSEP